MPLLLHFGAFSPFLCVLPNKWRCQEGRGGGSGSRVGRDVTLKVKLKGARIGLELRQEAVQ